MQNSLEILLQQLQDAELGGFDAQKDYAPPYRSLLTQEHNVSNPIARIWQDTCRIKAG